MLNRPTARVRNSFRADGMLFAFGGVPALGGLPLKLRDGGKYLFADSENGSDARDGLKFDTAVATFQKAVDLASAGDVIVLSGAFDEQVTIASTKSNLTIVGLGGKGATYVEPSGSNKTAITVKADDVTIINVGGAGDGTGSGLYLETTTRFRAYGCKFEGGANGVLLDKTNVDAKFIDCEVCWTTNAFKFDASASTDPNTQIEITDCLLHNYAKGILVATAHVVDLWVKGNIFARDEAGDEPTLYIDADVASTTGILAGNYFPCAENSAKIETEAGTVRVGNYFTNGLDA